MCRCRTRNRFGRDDEAVRDVSGFARVGFGLCLLLVGACDGNAPSSTGRTPSSSATSAARCRGSDLVVSLDGIGYAAPMAAAQFRLRNVASGPCVIRGAVEVELLDSSRKPIPTQIVAADRSEVSLGTGSVGNFLVEFDHREGSIPSCSPAAAYVVVTLPGPSTPIVVSARSSHGDVMNPCAGRIEIRSVELGRGSDVGY
jgi:hypothetical protein